MIAENLAKVKERIVLAAERSGRAAEEIKLVVVTKGRTVEEIQTLLTTGHYVIGENRVQETQQKYDYIQSKLTKPNNNISPANICEWHLVGHLQRNKVKSALDMFDMVHSVDSLRLIEEISRRAEMKCQQADILIQINTTGEESKFGINANDVYQLLEQSLSKPGICIKGLMTMGMLNASAQENRAAFALLRTIAEKIEAKRFPKITMEYLSMGMTNDFEVAIEEGANIVRIGRAIFGSTE